MRPGVVAALAGLRLFSRFVLAPLLAAALRRPVDVIVSVWFVSASDVAENVTTWYTAFGE